MTLTEWLLIGILIALIIVIVGLWSIHFLIQEALGDIFTTIQRIAGQVGLIQDEIE